MIATVLTTGALTLCGVVIGGAINLSSGVLLDRRRQQREVRTAARLIVSELSSMRIDLGFALEHKQWGSVTKIDVSRWNEHEGRLAAALDNSDWNSLSALYRSVELFVDESSYDPSAPMLGDDLAHARMTLDVLLDALPRMQKLAGELPTDSDPLADPAYQRYLEASGEPLGG
jgi:hypothetical protein